MLEMESANETQAQQQLYATVAISFWSWIRSFVFTDNIRETVAQYITVPLGIILLPPLTFLKLISSNLQTVLNFGWKALTKVYEMMLHIYDSVEEPRSGGLIGQMFGFLLYGLMIYGLWNLLVALKTRYWH